MTVPSERRSAVNRTKNFLVDLQYPKRTPRVPRAIREQASRLLRHYPSQFYMDMAAQEAPGIFGEWDGSRPKEPDRR